ncbi:hypothetical protein [Yersinia ruckeri]|uniref:hypothetical protein n=1 Tax=Yersinia ruckeri TaxID=29486 RepID=UPI002238B12B|nr:hypothetical protein [Yersinia ruckeri]MCW6598856.1 hypothetical protein [Yersinia ruckeri]
MKISTITAAIQASIAITLTKGKLESRDIVYLKGVAKKLTQSLDKNFPGIQLRMEPKWLPSNAHKNYWVIKLASYLVNAQMVAVELYFVDGTHGYILDGYKASMNGGWGTQKTGLANKVYNNKMLIEDLTEAVTKEVTKFG